MKKIVLGMGLVAAIALPAGAVARPDQSNKRAAKAECKAERGKSKATREAFNAKYHGFSRCVLRNAAEEEAEEETAQKNAAKECKAERAADPVAFNEKYGTNKNKKNAYGKCVSGKASKKKAEMDAEDAEEAKEFRNAAKECAAEREALGREAFAAKYGTNPNKRNAFGKCVSGKAKESGGGS
jgi:hypothetical protein